MPYFFHDAFRLILFVLSLILIGKTFYNLYVAYGFKRNGLQSGGKTSTQKLGFFTIELLRPVAFFKIFANYLTFIFLSQYFLQITILSKMPKIYASWLYVFYMFFLVLAMIPSGYFVETKNLKNNFILVTILESLLYVGFAFAHSFLVLILLQIFFGILKPFSSAIEYAYIFRVSSVNSYAQAVSLYTNSLRGAIIAGTFIGGILVGFCGLRITFLVAALILLATSVYIYLVLPKIRPQVSRTKLARSGAGMTFVSVLKELPNILKNKSFAVMLCFVAIPLGALEDGVLFFCLPLVLQHVGVSRSIIAELFVLFSLGFLLTNKWIAKKSDAKRAERKYVFYGCVGMAASIIPISLVQNSVFGLLMVAIALFAIGAFRGFVISPTVAIVSKGEAARAVGKNVALSVYNIANSVGRIIGPIVLMQLLLFIDFSAISYFIMAIFFMMIPLASVFVYDHLYGKII
ncbi:MAG: MFS transporter [Gammaproteobacteria bacterium]|nr:MFS transporter [Gammaproteobacteria bacterium]